MDASKWTVDQVFENVNERFGEEGVAGIRGMY